MPDFHHLTHDYKLWRLNVRLAAGIRKPFSKQVGDFSIASGKSSDLKAVLYLHQELFHAPLLGWLKWVYRLRASELMTVLRNGQGQIIGYSLCMFNVAEVGQHIVHEVYVGIAPAYQGQGLATLLRRAVVESYNHGSLRAISTLAPLDDVKALRSAQKVGYAIVKYAAKPPAYYLLHALSKRA